MRVAEIPEEGPIIAPTVERARHNQIKVWEGQYSDDSGAISRPWRVVGTLSELEDKGKITQEMRQAGDDFHSDFILAQLNPLKAQHFTRLGHVRHEITSSIVDAKERINDCLIKLGGRASPMGSISWHVLGLEESINQWRISQGLGGRGIKHGTATKLLYGALDIIRVQYGY